MEHTIYSSTENLCHSGKSITEIKTSVTSKRKPKKKKISRQYYNKWYQEIP